MAGSPQVAIDAQGGITAVWSRADGGNYKAEATYRPAEGFWQTPVTLSEAGYDAGDVQLASDERGEAVAVWDTFPPASARTIQAAVKSPISGSWSTPVTLATIGEPVGNPQVAIDSYGNAIAVWEEQPQSSSYQFIQASVKPAGGTWSAPVHIYEGPAARDPHIAMDGEGTAIVTWLGFNAIESATRLASAETWQPPVKVAPSGLDAGGHPGGPELAVNEKDDAVVAWSSASGNGANHIVQAATLVKGGTWQAPVELSSPAMNAAAPHVAIDLEGNATAVWSGAEGSNNTVIQSATMPAGGAWQVPVDISKTGEKADNLPEPEIAIGRSGNATAVWEDNIGGNQIIQSSVKSREGTNWQTPTVLSGTDTNAVYPKLGVEPQGNVDSSGNAIAVWEQGLGSSDTIQAAGYDAGPLLLSFRISTGGAVGTPIYFSSSSAGVWSAFEGANWNFGDGSSANGDDVSHVYSTVGTYRLTLSSVDALGNTNSVSFTESIYPPQTEPKPLTAPKLTHVSLTNKRFRVARQRTAVAAKKAPLGTNFRFRLSSAAQLTIAIKQVRQLRGRVCSKRARSHPGLCTRTIALGKLTRSRLPAGSNKVSFSGRIGSHALSPGNYEASLSASNANGRSSPVTLVFSVLSP